MLSLLTLRAHIFQSHHRNEDHQRRPHVLSTHREIFNQQPAKFRTSNLTTTSAMPPQQSAAGILKIFQFGNLLFIIHS